MFRELFGRRLRARKPFGGELEAVDVDAVLKVGRRLLAEEQRSGVTDEGARLLKFKAPDADGFDVRFEGAT